MDIAILNYNFNGILLNTTINDNRFIFGRVGTYEYQLVVLSASGDSFVTKAAVGMIGSSSNIISIAQGLGIYNSSGIAVNFNKIGFSQNLLELGDRYSTGISWVFYDDYDQACYGSRPFVNWPPSDILLSINYIPETAKAGNSVAKLLVKDSNCNDQINYSIAPSPSYSNFAVVNSENDLVINIDATDMDADQIVAIRATDSFGGTYDEVFVIPIAYAPSDIVLNNNYINNNIANGAAIANISAVDSDEGDSHSFSLVNIFDSNKFRIVNNTLYLSNHFGGDDLENSETIAIKATDSKSLTYTKTFNLLLNYVPTALSASNNMIGMSFTNGSFIANIILEGDSEWGQYNYRIIGGVDRYKFQMIGDDLHLAQNVSGVALSNVSVVRINVFDNYGGSYSQDLNFSIYNDLVTNNTCSITDNLCADRVRFLTVNSDNLPEESENIICNDNIFASNGTLNNADSLNGGLGYNSLSVQMNNQSVTPALIQNFKSLFISPIGLNDVSLDLTNMQDIHNSIIEIDGNRSANVNLNNLLAVPENIIVDLDSHNPGVKSSMLTNSIGVLTYQIQSSEKNDGEQIINLMVDNLSSLIITNADNNFVQLYNVGGSAVRDVNLNGNFEVDSLFFGNSFAEDFVGKSYIGARGDVIIKKISSVIPIVTLTTYGIGAINVTSALETITSANFYIGANTSIYKINLLDKIDNSLMRINGTNYFSVSQPLNESVSIVSASYNAAGISVQFADNPSFLPASFEGSFGSDNVVTSQKNDIIYSGGGVDEINSRSGDDEIYSSWYSSPIYPNPLSDPINTNIANGSSWDAGNGNDIAYISLAPYRTNVEISNFEVLHLQGSNEAKSNLNITGSQVANITDVYIEAGKHIELSGLVGVMPDININSTSSFTMSPKKISNTIFDSVNVSVSSGQLDELNIANTYQINLNSYSDNLYIGNLNVPNSAFLNSKSQGKIRIGELDASGSGTDYTINSAALGGTNIDLLNIFFSFQLNVVGKARFAADEFLLPNGANQARVNATNLGGVYIGEIYNNDNTLNNIRFYGSSRINVGQFLSQLTAKIDSVNTAASGVTIGFVGSPSNVSIQTFTSTGSSIVHVEDLRLGVGPIIEANATAGTILDNVYAESSLLVAGSGPVNINLDPLALVQSISITNNNAINFYNPNHFFKSIELNINNIQSLNMADMSIFNMHANNNVAIKKLIASSIEVFNKTGSSNLDVELSQDSNPYRIISSGGILRFINDVFMDGDNEAKSYIANTDSPILFDQDLNMKSSLVLDASNSDNMIYILGDIIAGTYSNYTMILSNQMVVDDLIAGNVNKLVVSAVNSSANLFLRGNLVMRDSNISIVASTVTQLRIGELIGPLDSLSNGLFLSGDTYIRISQPLPAAINFVDATNKATSGVEIYLSNARGDVNIKGSPLYDIISGGNYDDSIMTGGGGDSVMASFGDDKVYSVDVSNILVPISNGSFWDGGPDYDIAKFKLNSGVTQVRLDNFELLSICYDQDDIKAVLNLDDSILLSQNLLFNETTISRDVSSYCSKTGTGVISVVGLPNSAMVNLLPTGNDAIDSKNNLELAFDSGPAQSLSLNLVSLGMVNNINIIGDYTILSVHSSSNNSINSLSVGRIVNPSVYYFVSNAANDYTAIEYLIYNFTQTLNLGGNFSMNDNNGKTIISAIIDTNINGLDLTHGTESLLIDGFYGQLLVDRLNVNQDSFEVVCNNANPSTKIQNINADISSSLSFFNSSGTSLVNIGNLYMGNKNGFANISSNAYHGMVIDSFSTSANTLVLTGVSNLEVSVSPLVYSLDMIDASNYDSDLVLSTNQLDDRMYVLLSENDDKITINGGNNIILTNGGADQVISDNGVSNWIISGSLYNNSIILLEPLPAEGVNWNAGVNNQNLDYAWFRLDSDSAHVKSAPTSAILSNFEMMIICYTGNSLATLDLSGSALQDNIILVRDIGIAPATDSFAASNCTQDPGHSDFVYFKNLPNNVTFNIWGGIDNIDIAFEDGSDLSQSISFLGNGGTINSLNIHSPMTNFTIKVEGDDAINSMQFLDQGGIPSTLFVKLNDFPNRYLPIATYGSLTLRGQYIMSANSNLTSVINTDVVVTFENDIIVQNSSRFDVDGNGGVVVSAKLVIRNNDQTNFIYSNTKLGLNLTKLSTNANQLYINGDGYFSISSSFISPEFVDASGNSGGVYLSVVNSTIIGSSANDVILVSNGSLITGGPGADSITAGLDHAANQFIFARGDTYNAANIISRQSGSWAINSTNIDTITNFVPGLDKILLTRSTPNILYGEYGNVTLDILENILDSSQLSMSPGNVVILNDDNDLYFIIDDDSVSKLFYNGSSFDTTGLSVIKLIGDFNASEITGSDWFVAAKG